MTQTLRRVALGMGLVIGVLFGGVEIATAAFSAGDLAETWFFQGLDDSTGSNDPGWTSGTLAINAAGTVTGGTAVNSWGETLPVTGGSFAIDSVGQVGGSISTSYGSVNLPHGKLNPNKTILTFVTSIQFS